MIAIRPARDDEGAALTHLARAAKASWGYPPEWLRAWEPDLELSAEYLQTAVVLVAEVDGVLAGVIGLDTSAAGPEIGHLWVAPEAQRRGVGSALLEAGLDAARARGWRLLRIESDPFARPFYERHGATYAGEVDAAVCGTPTHASRSQTEGSGG